MTWLEVRGNMCKTGVESLSGGLVEAFEQVTIGVKGWEPLG